jgi:hypothetical protein
MAVHFGSRTVIGRLLCHHTGGVEGMPFGGKFRLENHATVCVTCHLGGLFDHWKRIVSLRKRIK